MSLSNAIAAIESALQGKSAGLPPTLFEFVSRITPLANVDLLIQEPDLGTLLTWRHDQIYGSGWHVPGGVIRFKETMHDRVKAVARDELGTEVIADATPVLIYESISQRETRGHFISFLYRCRLVSPPEQHRRAKGDVPELGQWRWHSTCPSNIIEAHSHYARFF